MRLILQSLLKMFFPSARLSQGEEPEHREQQFLNTLGRINDMAGTPARFDFE